MDYCLIVHPCYELNGDVEYAGTNIKYVVDRFCHTNNRLYFYINNKYYCFDCLFFNINDSKWRIHQIDRRFDEMKNKFKDEYSQDHLVQKLIDSFYNLIYEKTVIKEREDEQNSEQKEKEEMDRELKLLAELKAKYE